MPTQLELEALHRQESSEHNAQILETKVTRGKADIFDGKIPAGQLPTPTPPEKQNLTISCSTEEFVESGDYFIYSGITTEMISQYDKIIVDVQQETGFDNEIYLVNIPLLNKEFTIDIFSVSEGEMKLGARINKTNTQKVSITSSEIEGQFFTASTTSSVFFSGKYKHALSVDFDKNNYFAEIYSFDSEI